MKESSFNKSSKVFLFSWSKFFSIFSDKGGIIIGSSFFLDSIGILETFLDILFFNLFSCFSFSSLSFSSCSFWSLSFSSFSFSKRSFSFSFIFDGTIVSSFFSDIYGKKLFFYYFLLFFQVVKIFYFFLCINISFYQFFYFYLDMR